ncbi:bacillithiol biosynthesis cysteine-adding enzyme BshC [Candidatus Sumerlaeota bacterium]|nr:bacillithiol biosynthesis cysteine-adding enzyme BshC [Candidatus Sumerlaeota bacterium]
MIPASGNRLWIDSVTDFHRVAPFFEHDHRLEALGQVSPTERHRPLSASDMEALVSFNIRPFSDAKVVRSLVERLADPECQVILTGQQAGLLLGPLYTVLKAMHAIRLARHLEETTGRPAVAIFWIASEDHDFEEVNHVTWLDSAGQRRRFELPLPAGYEGHSVGPMPLDCEALESLLDTLAKTTPETEFRALLFDAMRESQNTSEALGELFLDQLLRLLQPQGLIAVDPWFAPIKEMLKRVCRWEIENPGASTALVLETSKRLQAAGYTPQIHRREGDINLFLFVEGVRCRLETRDGDFLALHPGSGETLARLSARDLLERLESRPELFSPNVVTKPLVRDAVFLPVAYVAGPGEMAYHAQLRALYGHHGIAMPAIVPRVQGVLVSPPIQRALRKLGLTAEEWLTMPSERRSEHIARQGIGGKALESFDALRRSVSDRMSELSESIVSFDPGLRRSAERAVRGLEGGLERLAEQMTQSAQRRDEKLATAASRVEEALTPGGQPQERCDNLFIPHLLMHGPGLVERLLSDLRLDAPGPQVFEIH